MELNQRTGQILTAGSNSHGKAFKWRVEHKVTRDSARSGHFGTQIAPVVAMLKTLFTRMSPVVAVLPTVERAPAGVRAPSPAVPAISHHFVMPLRHFNNDHTMTTSCDECPVRSDQVGRRRCRISRTTTEHPVMPAINPHTDIQYHKNVQLPVPCFFGQM